MSVSVREVAALAGVSVGTVSNVLNRPEKVTAQTVAKVRQAVAELGFVRNEAARQLRAGRSTSIGLVVAELGDPAALELARGAEERAAEGSHAVLLGNSAGSAEREKSYLELFQTQRVHGVLLAPVADALERARSLRERGMPTVLINSRDEPGEFSSVCVDDVVGGRLAVDHLIGLGRRRIAFVGGPLDSRPVADRLRGARAAVDEVHGASLEVIDAAGATVLHGRAIGEELRERAAYARPEAVFAANDLLAIGILQGLTLVGALRIPQDIALIGYDDIDFAAATVVPLSSVRQPSAEVGAAAVDLLLREAAAGEGAAREQILFEPELVVRESTGAPA